MAELLFMMALVVGQKTEAHLSIRLLLLDDYLHAGISCKAGFKQNLYPRAIQELVDLLCRRLALTGLAGCKQSCSSMVLMIAIGPTGKPQESSLDLNNRRRRQVFVLSSRQSALDQDRCAADITIHFLRTSYPNQAVNQDSQAVRLDRFRWGDFLVSSIAPDHPFGIMRFCRLLGERDRSQRQVCNADATHSRRAEPS